MSWEDYHYCEMAKSRITNHFLVEYAIKHTPTTFERNLQYNHKRIVFEIADTIDKPKQHQQPTATSGTIELSTTIQNAN